MFKEEQEKINKLYEKHGLTDEVLELQVELNQKRNKENIVDESKTVHKKYVQ